VIKGTHAVFVDTSDANPMEWSWNFGDGKSSMVRNPTHTYEKPGTYTITLTVSNSAGSSTASKVLIIK
jgi:PKD repeat protein